jgi:hypothetical protein
MRHACRPRSATWRALSAALVGIVGLAAIAEAAPIAPRTVRLTFVLGAGAGACPDEDVVRAGVAARLGYEPFDERAEMHVIATVTRIGLNLEAHIEIVDASGAVTAERKLSSPGRDCAELASAVEFAVSIAVDPAAGARPRAPIAAEPAPAPTAVPAPPSPAPPRPPVQPPPPQVIEVVREPATVMPAVSTVLQVTVGVVGAVASAPAAAMGGMVQVAARRAAFSLGVDGRADLPASARLRTGMVQAGLLTAAIVPCWHMRILSGCLLGRAGVMRAAGVGLVEAKNATSPFVALGARVGVAIPLGESFFVAVHASVLAPLTETVLRVSGETVWTSPPVGGELALGMGARFP